MTTISSLGAFHGLDSKESYAAAMIDAAARKCMRSKANGSLMRKTPLGIWGHNSEASEIATAIATLIRQPGERQLAFDHAKFCLESQEQTAKEQKEHTNSKEVRNWLADAENMVFVPFEPHIGFVKIGFTHAFFHLLMGSNYTEAIAKTLAGGGDTDTIFSSKLIISKWAIIILSLSCN